MSSKYLNIYEELSTGSDNQNPPAEYIANLIKSAVPTRDVESIYKQRVFLLPKSPLKKAKKVQRKNAKISRKEKQQLNLLKVPKTGWDYNAFEPLRTMWLEYMISYLSLDKDRAPKTEDRYWTAFNSLLGKADYHGAEMTVLRSKCPSLVGISGTCILDTKNTFRILSKDNKARIVPKKDSVFKLRVKNLEITIFGKYFTTRPADRSAKKVKSSMVLDL